MLTQADITLQIQEVLEELRPYFFMHGGNITFVKFENGTVYVRLAGTCSACPSSHFTLKLMVEDALRREVPQVQEVVEIDL